MRSIDVTKCFESIYTHTLSWAVKDKAFAKKNIPNDATFAESFDRLMQGANHNETNGIVIGPEVSRIFAEIILQEVDRRAVAAIAKKCKYEFGVEFSIRRYVDDIYIFADNAVVAKEVEKIYSDQLLAFNLHINPSKIEEVSRPFVTHKSRLIHLAGVHANDFFDKFLADGGDYLSLVPRRIRSIWRLTHSFIENIKSLCSYSQATYDEVASFLISVLSERIKKLVAPKVIKLTDHDEFNYRDAFVVLLEVMFFLYKVSPSVTASYKISTSIILTIRFSRMHLPAVEMAIAQRIFDLTSVLLGDLKNAGGNQVEDFLHLESLNVVLASRELGAHYLLAERDLSMLFRQGEKQTYFSIVSCLYYVRDSLNYKQLREYMISRADDLLKDLGDIKVNSEKAHLLLDLCGCPYVPLKTRKVWIRRAFKACQIAEPTAAQYSKFEAEFASYRFFVDWSGRVDLLTTLEKKELKQAY